MVQSPRSISILRNLIDSGRHPDKVSDLIASFLKSIQELHIVPSEELGLDQTSTASWFDVLMVQQDSGLFSLDFCSPSLRISEGFARIIGFGSWSVLPKKLAFHLFSSISDQKQIISECIENFSNKKPFVFLFSLSVIDGSILHFKVSACYRFENEQIIGLFGQVHVVKKPFETDLFEDSELILKSVFESSPLARIVVDRWLNIHIHNPNAARLALQLWGFEPKIGQSITDFLPKSTRSLVQKLLRKVVSGEKIRHQIQIDTPILGLRWMDFEMNPITQTNQEEIIGVVLNLRDITEIKLQNEAAESAKRQLNLALSVTNAAFWEYNIDTGTYWWSKEHYELFKINPSVVPNLSNWLNSILPIDKELVETAVARSIVYKEELSIKFRIPSNGDSGFKWISCNGRIQVDEGTKTQRLIVIEIDCTEQNERLAKQKYAEQNYQDLLSMLPLGVFKTNLEGHCYYINQRCTQIIGLDANNAMGLGWTTYLDPGDYVRLSNAMNLAIEKDNHQIIKENIRFKGPGIEVSANAYIKLETDVYGNPIEFVGLFKDASQLINADRKLKKLNEALINQYNKLRKYAHINSHELRGPLTTMMSILNLLRNNNANLDHDFIDALLKSSDKMDMVIKELNELLNDVEFEQIVEDNFELNSTVKVAIIDDDEFQNMVNSKIIQNINASIEITTFTEATIAFDAILNRVYTPDLILLNLNIPGLDGWTLLDELEKNHIQIQIYILTSSINPSDFVRAKSYRNVKGFLSKPLKPELINEVLSKFIPIQ